MSHGRQLEAKHLSCVLLLELGSSGTGDAEYMSALPTESEGWQLHLSTRGKTGYRGVHYHPRSNKNKPYTVIFHSANAGPNDIPEQLGTFATAVEGAVCFAKHAAKHKMYSSVRLSADGLWLSSQNESGYVGVSRDSQQPAKPWKVVGYVPGSSKAVCIGRYSKVKEAARAYADWKQEVMGDQVAVRGLVVSSAFETKGRKAKQQGVAKHGGSTAMIRRLSCTSSQPTGVGRLPRSHGCITHRTL